MAERTATGRAAPAVAVSVRDLRVQRGRSVVLDGIDVDVPAGEWAAVVGPNGAGKTTLLHVVAGLLGRSPGAMPGPVRGGDARVAGRVDVLGVDPRSASRRRIAREVALVPQRPVVPSGATVADLVLLGRAPHLRPWAFETRADHDLVDAALARLGLDGLARRDASQLSGGELQRVILARALVQQPKVLLLDEPTSALDIGYQQSVLDLVDMLRVQEGLTVIAAMHDLTLVGQYADRLLLLDQGQVVADGPPSHVLTVEFLSKVYGARVRVIDTSDGPVVAPLRREWE